MTDEVLNGRNLTDRFMKSAGHHLVTLSCIQKISDKSEGKVLVFSGFLIESGGVWFYVTAGHILRDIRKAIGQGVTFDVWRLGDQTAGNKFNDTAVPYGFDLESWGVIQDDKFGLDYAAVPLEGLYCRQLQAGGAVPITKDAWGIHLTEHESWALVGVPSESVSYDGKTLITAKVVVAPLEPTTAPPSAGSRAKNQFYGRLKDDSIKLLKDVDGMSGGPIFALKKVGDTWKYSIIGLQSGWYDKRRIVAACPISSFALALEKLVTQARNSMEPDGHAS